MGKATKFELEFIKKEEIAKDTYSFYFNRKNLVDFDFFPGQYLKLRIDIDNPDDRGTSRYFTISSSPTDKDYVVITTKIIKSSFKIALMKLNPGDKISAFGPIGYFDFNPKSKLSNIFLAGGIGVTPYHSLLRNLDIKKNYPKITLIVSFSKKKEIIFFDEFKEYQKRNQNLKIIYTFTKESLTPSGLSGFEIGRINEDLIKKYCPDYKKSKYFITGPENMVNSLYDLVLGLQISEENIFKEDFPGY